MAEPIHELHEHAEKARGNSGLVGATFTMSVVAVLVAAVSVAGHRAHTGAILDQTRAGDLWAEYQAHSIRRHNYELFMDLLSLAQVRDPGQAAKAKERYGREAERYARENEDLSAQARGFEDEAAQHERQAARFDLGEVCLEAALVITSITLITRKRLFWGMGSALALAGIAVAASGAWVH
ncbi:MAG TPA: DUF4337 domain-containing protein [Terriglobia bacterium]|nr:DUF4337 domain-containing protein [Terriglobia bacterium]